ncbi:MAG TPA: hypothetical protein VGD91_20335, partial [Trebonia sp.]
MGTFAGGRRGPHEPGAGPWPGEETFPEENARPGPAGAYGDEAGHGAPGPGWGPEPAGDPGYGGRNYPGPGYAGPPYAGPPYAGPPYPEQGYGGPGYGDGGGYGGPGY